MKDSEYTHIECMKHGMYEKELGQCPICLIPIPKSLELTVEQMDIIIQQIFQRQEFLLECKHEEPVEFQANKGDSEELKSLESIIAQIKDKGKYKDIIKSLKSGDAHKVIKWKQIKEGQYYAEIHGKAHYRLVVK